MSDPSPFIDIGGVKIDLRAQMKAIERYEAEQSLYNFLQMAWPHFESSPFSDGWVLEAICEALEAVTDGEIRRLIVNIPPRTGKPVSGAALVNTMRGLIPLREVVVGDCVLTHMGRFREVREVHQQGEIETLRVTTRSGRSVVAAPDHPFLTPEGWRYLSDIESDDVLGTVPQYAPSGVDTIPVEEARLLGYIIGDGCCSGTPNITVADDIEAEDIRRVIRACGFDYTDQAYKMAGNGYLLRRISLKRFQGTSKRVGGYGPVRNFLQSHGLWKGTSYTKLIPDAVLRGSDSIVENFIGAYWACDGYITTKGAKRDGTERTDFIIGCDSVNYGFMRQMQQLLLRIGISSRVRKKVAKIKTKRQGDKYVSYSLTIADQDNCWRFANRIKLIHSKNDKIVLAKNRRFDFDQTLRGEVVDTIVGNGREECFCLTVDEDSSFVANGFAVHNTSIISAAWPAWVWAQSQVSHTSGPGVEFIASSYNLKLAREGSDKCRRIIKSDWYQGLFGDRFQLRADKDGIDQFANDKFGQRTVRSVGAGITGLGSNILLIDDANSASDESSEITREGVIEWYKGTLVSRLNDPKLGAIVNVQQRIAVDDLTGWLLDNQGEDWEHLCVPMRFDSSRKSVLCTGWEDPRTQEGELLWPKRFGEREVANLEKSMGPFRAAGQLQQLPRPASGGIINSDWWQPWGEDAYPQFDYVIAGCDTAYGEKQTSDFSAMTIWGVYQHQIKWTPDMGIINGAANIPAGTNVNVPHVMLMYAWAERLEFHELVKKIAATARRFNVDKLLIENKASGISVAQEMRRLYSYEPFGVQLSNPGALDKVARLYSVQHLFADGIVHAPDKEWAQKVINQVSDFPKGRNDDLVDCVSMSIRKLRDMGMLTRSPERANEIEEGMRFRGRKEDAPLYPV